MNYTVRAGIHVSGLQMQKRQEGGISPRRRWTSDFGRMRQAPSGQTVRTWAGPHMEGQA